MRSTTYRSYIIRCWEEPTQTRETAVSRFILEIPETGQKQGFTEMESLFQALAQVLQPSTESDILQNQAESNDHTGGDETTSSND